MAFRQQIAEAGRCNLGLRRRVKYGARLLRLGVRPRPGRQDDRATAALDAALAARRQSDDNQWALADTDPGRLVGAGAHAGSYSGAPER